MAQITLKGSAIHTLGDLPKQGTVAPDFKVTKIDLTDIKLTDFVGKTVVLNIFPSVDTPTCAMSVRKFNEQANDLASTVVLCISADLPFALKRFCAAEGLDNIIPASVFRHAEFAKHYAVQIIDGPLAGLLSRAVVVIDKTGKIIYTDQVSEIADEPDYAAVKSLLHK